MAYLFNWLMSERSDRLRQAMKAARLTQREAVERYGWNANTLKSNLNGSIDFSYKAALRYGARLKVRAEWLYDGNGPMFEVAKSNSRPDRTVPLISWVSAGQISDIGQIDDMTDVELLTVSGLPDGQYFATEVKGDSMDRVSPEGSKIIVNVAERTPVAGGYYIFSKNGETTFKRYYDFPIKRLEPYSLNPMNKTIFLTNGKWCVIGRVVRSFIDLN